MSASLPFPFPTRWSTCSVSDLNDGFANRDLDRCLTNEPAITFGDPVCGNGIREGDEVCDCGSSEFALVSSKKQQHHTTVIASFPVSTPQLFSHIVKKKVGEWRLGTRLLQ